MFTIATFTNSRIAAILAIFSAALCLTYLQIVQLTDSAWNLCFLNFSCLTTLLLSQAMPSIRNDCGKKVGFRSSFMFSEKFALTWLTHELWFVSTRYSHHSGVLLLIVTLLWFLFGRIVRFLFLFFALWSSYSNRKWTGTAASNNSLTIFSLFSNAWGIACVLPRWLVIMLNCACWVIKWMGKDTWWFVVEAPDAMIVQTEIWLESLIGIVCFCVSHWTIRTVVISHQIYLSFEAILIKKL